MIEIADIAFINGCLDRYYGDHRFFLPAKSAPFDPEDGGVPPEMFAGDIDREGWVTWKMLHSSAVESDVEEIEREFGVTFPALFRAYLVARFHLFDQVNVGGVGIMIPSLPADSPFRDLRRELSAWQPLIPSGYIPFGEYEDQWGPICFDMSSQVDSDSRIVWFDHEELLRLPSELIGDRSRVEPLSRPLFSSFRELMSTLRNTPGSE